MRRNLEASRNVGNKIMALTYVGTGLICEVRIVVRFDITRGSNVQD